MTVGIRSRGGAYAALALLTLLWAANWPAMKFALYAAPPVSFNLQRTWLAVAVLFAVLVVQRRPLWPASWLAVVVTGFFQTTMNFGSTTMALAGGSPGRTSVLVFTMPFWTMLIAWPVLGERVRGLQWVAIALAIAGLLLLVAPWDWEGDLAPRLWAVLAGFGWAAGTIASKVFQRDRPTDLLTFSAWQTLLGVLPLTVLPLAVPQPATQWSVTQALLLVYVGVVSTAIGFLLWTDILRFLPAGVASLNMFAIPVLVLIMARVVFDERLLPSEWIGIACIGAGLALVVWRALRSGRADAALPAPTPADGG